MRAPFPRAHNQLLAPEVSALVWPASAVQVVSVCGIPLGWTREWSSRRVAILRASGRPKGAPGLWQTGLNWTELNGKLVEAVAALAAVATNLQQLQPTCSGQSAPAAHSLGRPFAHLNSGRAGQNGLPKMGCPKWTAQSSGPPTRRMDSERRPIGQSLSVRPLSWRALSSARTIYIPSKGRQNAPLPPTSGPLGPSTSGIC